MVAAKSKSLNFTGMMCGITIIVIGGISGLILFMSNAGGASFPFSLFYLLGIPFIACMIGVTLILRSVPFPGGSMFARRIGRPLDAEPSPDQSFIHQIPKTCSGCGAGINAETVEWVGPLSIKCPYCGVTLDTVKREV
ncbi:MAG: hypothetical protein RTU09_03675 [Candidatus Thorarchaeota archaeon]